MHKRKHFPMIKASKKSIIPFSSLHKSLSQRVEKKMSEYQVKKVKMPGIDELMHDDEPKSKPKFQPLVVKHPASSRVRLHAVTPRRGKKTNIEHCQQNLQMYEKVRLQTQQTKSSTIQQEVQPRYVHEVNLMETIEYVEESADASMKLPVLPRKANMEGCNSERRTTWRRNKKRYKDLSIKQIFYDQEDGGKKLDGSVQKAITRMRAQTEATSDTFECWK